MQRCSWGSLKATFLSAACLAGKTLLLTHVLAVALTCAPLPAKADENCRYYKSAYANFRCTVDEVHSAIACTSSAEKDFTVITYYRSMRDFVLEGGAPGLVLAQRVVTTDGRRKGAACTIALDYSYDPAGHLKAKKQSKSPATCQGLMRQWDMLEWDSKGRWTRATASFDENKAKDGTPEQCIVVAAYDDRKGTATLTFSGKYCREAENSRGSNREVWTYDSDNLLSAIDVESGTRNLKYQKEKFCLKKQ